MPIAPTTDTCIHRLVELQVERNPEACAAIFKNERLSYAELDSHANRLAWELVELGVGPDVTVGICAERSLEVIIGLLAILKAGGTCLPLDPQYPKERLAFMLQDGEAGFLLVDSQFIERLPETEAKIIRLDTVLDCSGAARTPPLARTSPDNLAYVIYTSGSTGNPNGVEVTHRGITRLLSGIEYVRLDETKTILQLSSLTFDGSIFEIWGALLNGGCCVLYPGRVPVVGELGHLLRKHRVTTAALTPSLFNAIVDEDPAVFACLEQLVLGGEPISVPHIRRAWDHLPNVEIINCYGPTEATVDACSFVIGAKPDECATSIPIGQPIRDTRVYILDPNLQPVPAGQPGELCIGGDCLARGYRNQPELTAQRFIPDPFADNPNALVFRTGDLARMHADGNLDFLGRMDDQVKVRGFRIELGEIEANLRRHAGVHDVMVLPYTDPRGENHVSAFVLREPGYALSAEELLQFLRQSLPAFMVPSRCCVMGQWPLTSSGKVDRRALATMAATKTAPTSLTIPPQTVVQKKLVQIWEQLLDIRPVGIQDSFFDLGGDSLQAILLLARIEETFRKRLPIAALLGAATIEQLAALLVEEESEDRLTYAVPIQAKGEKPIFFCVGAGTLFRPLSLHLGSDQPFFSVGLNRGAAKKLKAPYQMEELARHLVSELRERQPQGPYYLGGFCDDGVLAYEMARQLMEQGHIVGLLALFETSNPSPSLRLRIATGLRRVFIRLGFRFNQLLQLETGNIRAYARSRGKELKEILTMQWWRLSQYFGLAEAQPDPADLERILFLAVVSYKPKALSCPTVLFRGKDWPIGSAGDPYFGWRDLLTGHSETYEVPGDHAAIFREPNVEVLARQLRACLHTVGEH